ncbi:MAG: hypothetical protein ABIS44_09330 [Mycobacteriales bacterium]
MAVTVVATVLASTQFGDRGDAPADPAVPATSAPGVVTSQSPTAADSPSSSEVGSPPPLASVQSSAGIAPSSPIASATDDDERPLVVADLQPVDASFVSADVGWAFGAANCGPPQADTGGLVCTALLMTSDGGVSWKRVGAVAKPLPPSRSECLRDIDIQLSIQAASTCPQLLRFANSMDGFAVVNGGLWRTGDGGHAWFDLDTRGVVALEPAGGDVIRVVTTTEGCPPGCTFVVQKAPLHSSAWTTLKTPPLQGVGARLLRHGDDVYVFVYLNRAGGVEAHTRMVVSHDRGATWTQRPDPCSPVGPNAQDEIDAVDAAIGADGTFVMLCVRRLSTPDNDNNTLRISTDAAATFGSALPLFGSANRVAVGDANHIVVSADSGSTVQLLLSTDGGRNFASALTTERASQESDRFLAFTTKAVGTWIDGVGRLWRTNDGGSTWQQRSLG